MAILYQAAPEGPTLGANSSSNQSSTDPSSIPTGASIYMDKYMQNILEVY